MSVRESDLPGIGRKFEIEVAGGDKMVIIIHDDGQRELYHFYRDDPDECVSMITLDDEDARAAAAIIGGLAYRPRAMDNVDVVINNLVIEWYKVEESCYCIGKSIGELGIRKKTRVTIIAVLEKDGTKHVNPGAELKFTPGSTVVITGERKDLKAVKVYLQRGEI